MLSREKRLTHSRDFDAVYRKGKRISSNTFNLSYARNRLNISRVGVVVGKKFSKKAVERNKAKRIFREAIRDLYPQVSPGLDIVFFLKKTSANKPVLNEAIKEIKAALIKGGIVK